MAMITNDKGIRDLKREVLTEVCRLAWEGSLGHEERERIVLHISPGPRPQYRCCVYKEREIVRERIRLSMGLNADPTNNTKNVVQVIKAACDECPISAYSVTDSCRFCLGKPCQSACRFGAITPGEFRMHIDSSKCKECGQCAEVCPFGAVVHIQRPCKKVCPAGAITYDEYGFCIIDEEKCIQCGHCIHACPFGAIGSKIYAVRIIEAIREGREVIAMCAPATEGQFGKDVTMGSVRKALKKLGFADMVEVGLGGDMTAAYEALEWTEAKKEGRKMTTSCCPAFINMMKNEFPKQYAENMSGTVSPMVAVSRYLKATHPGCLTVFIGPCIAKKGECGDPDIADTPDMALTFGEMLALMDSKEIRFEPDPENYQEASIFGKNFAGSGGVASAVLECMKERGEDVSEIRLLSCAGGTECRKALLLLKNGRLPADFVEGMMCPGGCVGGPSRREAEKMVVNARKDLLSHADGRGVLENLARYPMESFSRSRDGK